jgi:hypothetical protein
MAMAESGVAWTVSVTRRQSERASGASVRTSQNRRLVKQSRAGGERGDAGMVRGSSRLHVERQPRAFTKPAAGRILPKQKNQSGLILWLL